MGITIALVALGLLLANCSQEEPVSRQSQREISLRELGSHPERFAVGDAVDVSGWLIKPPHSLLFICDEISRDHPPRAIGSCTEVENRVLLAAGDAQRLGGTAWLEEPLALTCRVAAYRPGDIDPERLVLSCGFDA